MAELFILLKRLRRTEVKICVRVSTSEDEGMLRSARTAPVGDDEEAEDRDEVEDEIAADITQGKLMEGGLGAEPNTGEK